MQFLYPAADLRALAVTLMVGLCGGTVARALHLPLGMLLGSLLAVGSLAALGWRPLGQRMFLPPPLRSLFVPVIGVSVGGAFTPAVIAEFSTWWVSLLGLLVFIPLAHGAGYLIYRRVGQLPRLTAFFGSVPGGLIETVQMGEAAGADPQMLTLLQFLRLIFCIIVVPVAFTLLTGHAVGSAAEPLLVLPHPGLRDICIMLAAGAAGVAVGWWLRFPAFIVTGPILVSALVHLAGWTAAVPPAWAVTVTQLVVGTSLGARFAGLPKGALTLALRLALLNGAVSLGLALAFALALAPVAAQPWGAVFLAYAPGGLAEMTLVALSLQLSVVYVAIHHVMRIVLSVMVARLLAARLTR